MRPVRFLLGLLLVSVSLPLAVTAKPGASATAPGQGTLQVGAASRTVLPLVNGSYSYLEAGFPDRNDAYDPGLLVPAWDDGRIAVGNGESESLWVHDDIRATALAIDDPRSPHIVVVLATDLYMVFRVDGEEIRMKAAALLPPGQAKKLKVIVSATHNHHGPDTAFDVNHDWYEHMTNQAAAAVAEAVKNRRPARLSVAAGEHWFGMNDGTDPQIFDPRLNVLQAVDTHGAVIATLVQWNNHPEGTLNWSPPPKDVIAEDCDKLGRPLASCTARGRYFTSDFPGILREDLNARYGGEVLYLNGALGVLVGPGGAEVWEVNDGHPLGNQMKAPPGAVGPEGDSNYTVRNFRRTAIIGEQLAAAVMRLLPTAEKITEPRVAYAAEPFYSYLSNIGFRVLLVTDPSTGRASLGHNVPIVYNCPLDGPKNDQSCVSDGYASVPDPLVGSIRKGDHLRTAVEYVRIGPVGMMFLPGEIPGELTIGLPAEFRVTPEKWYEEPAGRHAFGDDFRIPGYTIKRMSDRYKWTIGLGSDQLGYFVPISNFRVFCIADALAGPGTCAGLNALGFIEFPDSVAGATCKAITEDPSLLAGYPPLAAQAVAGSCRYGQAFDEADGHYEETNAAGWDLSQDMMDAVGRLLGNMDATEVNPDFPGWYEKNLPPGDLP